jgi:hypothetical protein
LEKTESEYNRDKYAECLAYYEAAEPGNKPSPDDVYAFENRAMTRHIAASFGDRIVRISSARALQEYRSTIQSAVSPVAANVDRVIELGCGYGIQLWRLKPWMSHVKMTGGEYARNAIDLAAELYVNVPDIDVQPFDFYDDHYGEVFAGCARRSAVVFTAHAISQLPSAKHAISLLQQHADRIQRVIHIEPVTGLYDESLLGLMRKRYAECNDYNRDLLEVLERNPHIRILRTVPNVMGTNPLTPVSVVEWEFR